MFVCSFLWYIRPREFDHRTFLTVWFVAAPTGFFLWLGAWKTYGAGGGQVTPIVAAIAIAGWCAYHKGAFDAWILRRRRSGVLWCGLTLLALFGAKWIIGSGVGPIKLAINCAIVGSLIPVAYRILAESYAAVSRFLQVAIQRWWMPVWRVLNRPVYFGGLKD